MSTHQDTKARLEEDGVSEEGDRVDPASWPLRDDSASGGAGETDGGPQPRGLGRLPTPSAPRVTVPGYAPSEWLEKKADPDDRERAPFESASQRSSYSSLDGVAMDQDVPVESDEFSRTAEVIQHEVCERLSADDCLDASDVLVSVSDGEVMLEGQVVDRRSKQRAEDIARSVHGVKQVHNRVEATKGVLAELGERILGSDDVDHGHSGSGTKNVPRATAR